MGARGGGCIWFWQCWVWDAFKICKRQLRMCICVIIFTYLWWIIVGFVTLSFIPYGQHWKLLKAIPMLPLPVNIFPLQLMMEYEWLRWWEGIGKDVEFGLRFNPWLWLWDALDLKPPMHVDCTEMGLSLHISYSDDVCPSWSPFKYAMVW